MNYWREDPKQLKIISSGKWRTTMWESISSSTWISGLHLLLEWQLFSSTKIRGYQFIKQQESKMTRCKLLPNMLEYLRRENICLNLERSQRKQANNISWLISSISIFRIRNLKITVNKLTCHNSIWATSKLCLWSKMVELKWAKG